MVKVDRLPGGKILAASKEPMSDQRKAEMIAKLRASGVKIVEHAPRAKRKKPPKPNRKKRRNMVRLDGRWTHADGNTYGE